MDWPGRSDGTSLDVISSQLLHMFDECMCMLPFATRTDMLDAMTKADVENKDLQDLLRDLLAEHDLPGVRVQLKTLWLRLAKDKFGDEEEAGGGAGTGTSKPASAPIPGKSKTPPGSPQA